jgi:hypothetical protein
MYPHNWKSGLPETPCGKGAKIAETETIRQELPRIVSRHNIQSIADVGCGDQNWMNKINWENPVAVQGFDAHPRERIIIEFDCVKQIVPAAFDMIQCIYVLNHLYEFGAVEQAIVNFKKSGIPWLFVTYNEFDKLPGLGEPVEKIYHKTKTSEAVERFWYYGLFRL